MIFILKQTGIGSMPIEFSTTAQLEGKVAPKLKKTKVKLTFSKNTSDPGLAINKHLSKYKNSFVLNAYSEDEKGFSQMIGHVVGDESDLLKLIK